MLFASPAFADPVELRIATLAPSGSPWMTVLNRSAEEIKEKTTGRVTLRFFEGGQQGDERDFIRKIKLGQLDGATVTSVGLSMIDQSIRLLEVPGLFESVEEIDYVTDKMWPYFQKKFEQKGFKLGDRGEVGWIYFLSRDRVDTIATLRELKLWQWGDDPVVGALYRKMSLNGVPLGVPEVDPGLTSGKINGCYGSPLTAVGLQWYTKVRYMISMPLTFGIGATVLSLSSLHRLSPEDQRLIETISQAESKNLRTVIRKANDDAKATMVRRGLTIVPTPAAMVNEFTQQEATVQQELIGKIYSRTELDLVIKYRDEFRSTRKSRLLK